MHIIASHLLKALSNSTRVANQLVQLAVIN